MRTSASYRLNQSIRISSQLEALELQLGASTDSAVHAEINSEIHSLTLSLERLNGLTFME